MEEEIVKSIINDVDKNNSKKIYDDISTNFKCNICLTNFSSFDMLLEHINDSTVHENITEKLQSDSMDHNGETYKRCPFCVQCFNSEKLLTSHLKSSHKNCTIHEGLVRVFSRRVPNFS